MAPPAVTGSDTLVPVADDVAEGDMPTEGRRGSRIYGAVLGGLLVGYMFMGRGFAHIGIGPIFIGDVVLLLGIVAGGIVLMRSRGWPPITWTVAFIVTFAALGAARTLPYLSTYGLDALRDGVLWGYAAFALVVYVIADRRLVLDAFRAYGWIVPIFAVWLPISWTLFRVFSADIDPQRPGSLIPLVFFKGGDMAIHVVGAIAFLVLGAGAIRSNRTFLWRIVVFVPLLWTIFVAGTSNRGALVTAILGIVAVAILAPRSRNWRPFLTAMALGAIALVLQTALTAGWLASAQPADPTPTPTPSVTVMPSPSQRPSAAPTSPADRPGTLSNSSFEEGPIGAGVIEDWEVGPVGTYHVVEGDAHDGTNFASVQNVGAAYEATLTSSSFRFDATQDIAVSFWAKAIAGEPRLEVYVNWYDRSGEMISGAVVAAAAVSTDGVETWQSGSGALEPPVDATHARVLFYETSGLATAGLDEVTIDVGDFIIEPAVPEGRPATLEQMIENLLSVFGPSSDPGLSGTREFRLEWWGTIVDYTFFGDHFWGGKGFGVNLADDDGFQSTADGSLRAPHNSHVTVLARMGVPAFALWLALQGLFALGLSRATLAFRRAGDIQLAALSAWVLVYWFAMMVNTSFDPYIEGPQGGIWFWSVFGLGLVLMQLRRRLVL